MCKYTEFDEQMVYCTMRILAPAQNCGDNDGCRTDRQRFNEQFLRPFGVISKQQLHHRQGPVCQGGTGCYDLDVKLDDTHSQINAAQSMVPVFIRSKERLISAHQET